MVENNGGPAFPPQDRVLICDVRDPDAIKRVADALTRDVKTGMSLRDYFAAKAMQAEMITTFSDATPKAAEAFIEGANQAGHGIVEHLAFNAYRVADAMLRAREVTHGR